MLTMTMVEGVKTIHVQISEEEYEELTDEKGPGETWKEILYRGVGLEV